MKNEPAANILADKAVFVKNKPIFQIKKKVSMMLEAIGILLIELFLFTFCCIEAQLLNGILRLQFK